MHTLSRSRHYLIIALTVSIALLLAPQSFSYITYWASLYAYSLFTVLERTTHPIRSWYDNKKTVRALEQALIDKNNHINELTAQLIHVKGIENERQQTQALHDFCARYDLENYITGRVIKYSTTTEEQSLIVDVGAHHGIIKNMIAITHNCVLGHVEAVFPYHAKIVTIADRRSKIPIRCATTHSTGIYTGTNSPLSGQLLFISHLQPILQGDMIMTSGDGYTYPAGFAIGTVNTFSLDERALHYKVNVQLLVDITQVTHVALLKSSYNGH